MVRRTFPLSRTLLALFLIVAPVATTADEAPEPASADTPAAAETAKAPTVDLMSQSSDDVTRKNEGCVSCHTSTDSASMHEADIPLACVDCHGGTIGAKDKETAHVAPLQADVFKTSANPVRSNAAFLKESPEFVQFMNPGDLRVADRTCGLDGCHADQVARVKTSMMTHGASLWGAALYNNGSIPVKDPRFGESYGRDGKPQALVAKDAPDAEATKKRGILPFLAPLARWEISQPGNILRFFERGGRKPSRSATSTCSSRILRGARAATQPARPRHGESHGPGLLRPAEDASARPDPPHARHERSPRRLPLERLHRLPRRLRERSRPGALRPVGPVRQPRPDGDGRPDDPEGRARPPDPAQFTSAIPSSQCVVCHMHPGTNVVNTYYGTTWWDNETDGERFVSARAEEALAASEQRRRSRRRTRGRAALRGLGPTPEFLANLTDLNPKLTKTQFADFHGHGWIFRNVYKQDRKGNLLDARGKTIPWDDPERFKKAVHLKDIHLEKGMHCVDCHFEQDAHGDGKLYGEVRNAIEIQCIDCHGSISALADPTARDWKTRGPAGGNPLKKYNRTAFGERVLQEGRQALPALGGDAERRVGSRADARHRGSRERALQRGLAPREDHPQRRQDVGRRAGRRERARARRRQDDLLHVPHLVDDELLRLPSARSRRTAARTLHNEGEKLRNWTGYNFQVLRDDVFMLGSDGTAAGSRISPVRSSSARARELAERRTASGSTRSSRRSPRRASPARRSTRTCRTPCARTETKVCTDCHVSDRGDNNAWMAQLLLHGTQLRELLRPLRVRRARRTKGSRRWRSPRATSRRR